MAKEDDTMALKYWQTMTERENSAPVKKYEFNPAEEDTSAVAEAGAEDEGEDTASEEEVRKHSNLPRPIAFIFKVLLAPLAIIGVTLVFAAIIVFTVAITVMSLGSVALGVFAIVEGIRNFSTAHYASIECIGIGFAAAALGLLLFTLALRCILRFVPHTSGLYGRSLKAIGRL